MSHTWATVCAAGLALTLCVQPTRGQRDCQPGWEPTFGQKAEPFVQAVLSQVVFDDGSGPAMYACGTFSSVGGLTVNYVARWDGSSWTALGSGLDSHGIALAVFDDGGGPALYAGGIFSSAGGVSANSLAKWDGTSWSDVGGGVLQGVGIGVVQALAVFDDGSGPALYVGGEFDSAGGVPAKNVARWDGTSFTALGAGFDDDVLALCGFDDGNGPALHAGGSFTSTGGSPVSHIARWDGTSWQPLGSGVDNWVRALVAFDDGGGAELYVGGDFAKAGVSQANHVAKWDGSSWSSLDRGVDGFGVSDFTVFDDGAGPALFVVGFFGQASGVPAVGVAKWDGSSWSAAGTLGAVGSIVAFDDGSGPTLYADYFKWVGTRWEPLTDGLTGSVDALTVFDDGGGPALYVGGKFLKAGALQSEGVVKWDGGEWVALGLGVGPYVEALAVFDDGGGPALYAGGAFFFGPLKWDGTAWSTVPVGVFGLIYDMAVFDDGSGPALYIGGYFSDAGGVGTQYIASWDGTNWSGLGAGLDGEVAALAVFDDGGGPALYAGGSFTTVGGAAQFIARWDGSSWTALGTGVSGGAVKVLTVFDDGGGPALYAGGGFSAAGGAPAQGIARWDGSSWSALGDGVSGGDVLALAGFDDGSGPALYAGGYFTTAGSVEANRIAKWDGSDWSALGSGMGDVVAALAVFDDGSGPALCVGGHFSSAPDSLDSYLARWVGCPIMWTWTDLGFALPGTAGAPALAGTGELAAGSRGTLTLSNAAPSAQTMLFLSLASMPAPFKGGTLVPVPVLWGLGGVTDAFGAVALEFHWPAGIPSGTSIFFQHAIVDAGAVQGVALSNALRADVP